jgi:aryl-alcohol dehydrogenase-like predicted oxidoreductase
MRYIELGKSGLKSSVLGFGCASIMGRAGRKQSLRALSRAIDLGVTFFDTARSYGYGESEQALGEFLQTGRDRLIVSTKFGIMAQPQRGWKNLMRPVVQTVVDVAPATRRLIQGFTKKQFKHEIATVALLHRSLEQSLRKLGASYIDILFLHAAPSSALERDDLFESLGRLIECGKIRLAGISASPDVIRQAIASRKEPIRALQFPINVFDASMANRIVGTDRSELVLVANQPFGGFDQVSKSRRWLSEVARHPHTPQNLADKLLDDKNDLLAEAVLNLILEDTGIHVAVTSMIQPQHLEVNIRAITNCRFTKDELRWLQRKLIGAAEPSLASS